MAFFRRDDTTGDALKRVADTLRPALEKVGARADVTYVIGGATLTVGYKTQNFKIHGRSMTGEITQVAHDEIGPSYRGFVLNVHVQPKGEVNQAVTPQTLREPYWQTDLDVTPLAGTQKQLYWALSYGSRTDTAILTQLRQTLRGLSGASRRGENRHVVE